MPLLLIGGAAGLVLGAGGVAIIDNTTGKLTSLAKWAAVAGGIYLAGRHLKAW